MVDDVAPKQAWESLRSDPQAQLVDVRTDPEWTFVGLPDLEQAGKQPVLIPWQVYPAMQVNAGFLDHLRQAGLTPEHQLFFMCRTGGRSRRRGGAGGGARLSARGQRRRRLRGRAGRGGASRHRRRLEGGRPALATEIARHGPAPHGR